MKPTDVLPTPAASSRPAPARVATFDELKARLRAASPALLEAEERGDATGRLDPGTVSGIYETGLLSCTLPADLGGPGLSLLDYVRAIADLARVAPSAALLAVMPTATVAVARVPEGLIPAAERAAFRRRRARMAAQVMQGRLYGVANTEPGSGGELRNTKTAVERGPDGVARLTGFKAFASFGPRADVWMCSARDAEGRVDAYLVAAAAPGVVYAGGWDAVGMRGTESVGIRLEGAPAEDVLAYRGMLEGPNARHFSTLGFAAVFAGVARAALDEARGTVGTSAWADVRYTEVATRVEAAEALVESVARQAEEWPLSAATKRRVVMAKVFAAETGVAAAEAALTLLGGRVYARAGRAARLLRDALAGPLLRPPLPLAYAEIARSFGNERDGAPPDVSP